MSVSPGPGTLAKAIALLALLALARVALADPVVAESRACEGTTAREASVAADRLYQRGEYQHAGECYQAAGDLAHANLAFLQAAGPTGEDSARELKAQREAARKLFAGVARAFRKDH